MSQFKIKDIAPLVAFLKRLELENHMNISFDTLYKITYNIRVLSQILYIIEYDKSLFDDVQMIEQINNKDLMINSLKYFQLNEFQNCALILADIELLRYLIAEEVKI